MPQGPPKREERNASCSRDGGCEDAFAGGVKPLYCARMIAETMAIVGVGLLGGSLGIALRERKLVREVIGVVRRPEARDECLKGHAVDRVTLDVREAAAEADCMVLCTPLSQMRSQAERIAEAARPGTLVTDVGSVKAVVVEELELLFRGRGVGFVGSHPMAGSEKTGVAHARGDLFEGAWCVVTPSDTSKPEEVQRVEDLWRAVGARVLRLPPVLHDELAARSSHLPFLVAAVLTRTVLGSGHSADQARLCAGGFRDTTRVASGSPGMWRDICLANRKAIVAAVREFRKGLEDVERVISTGDEDALWRRFTEAQVWREDWLRGSGAR